MKHISGNCNNPDIEKNLLCTLDSMMNTFYLNNFKLSHFHHIRNRDASISSCLTYIHLGTDTWTTSSDVAEDRIPVSYTRVVVGAMFFPTISTLVGKLFFGSVKSNAQRSLLVSIKFMY